MVARCSRHRVLINLVSTFPRLYRSTYSPCSFPLPPPPVLPGAPLLCVYTVGCTPNDIIVITHYLTSEATLQMILERIAREALFITTPLRYCSNNSSNSSSNKATRPLTMQSVPRKSAKPTISDSVDQSRGSIWNFVFRSFALCVSGRGSS